MELISSDSSALLRLSIQHVFITPGLLASRLNFSPSQGLCGSIPEAVVIWGTDFGKQDFLALIPSMG